MILRQIQSTLEANLTKQKVTILVGSRRVGKTELLRRIFETRNENSLWLNGEDMDTANILNQRSISNYKNLLQSKNLLIIDEAQYIPDIGRIVKLMIDEIQPLHIMITGSSSFDLIQKGEPLVGRSLQYQLFPFSIPELAGSENILETKQALEGRLIYGGYPELINLPSNAEKERYLKDLVGTYLLKDILVFENLRNSQKLKDLLVLLAYHIGSEVSLEELGKQLGMSKNTVEKYLDLLSKVFIIHFRAGFSSNLRKEIVKTKKWYFADNGIRNALINDFKPLALRKDTGELWEQMMINERLKRNSYAQANVESFFWRTYDQQEIDLIELENGKIAAFEFKWNQSDQKTPVGFSKAYPDATFQVIHPGNYLDWLKG